MIKKTSYLFLVFILAGCAHATQYVPLPDQAKEIDDPAKGRIYVIRPTRFGFAVPMEISDDGQAIGKTVGHSYVSWERGPGNVVLQGHAENTENLPLLVKEGRRTYVKQSVEMGIIMARNSLAPMDELTAKQHLSKLKPPKVELKKDVS